MKWGLSPLRRMENDLKQIESGNKDKLEGDYPEELRGVTDNFNLLIESERKQQSRYRTTLGDLAHSLKTPLAVIAGVLPKLKEKHINEFYDDISLNRRPSVSLEDAYENHKKIEEIYKYS